MSHNEIIRISPVATRSSHERILVVDKLMINNKAQDARKSARKREVHVFHFGDEDLLQRMLNAIHPGSYITPHRHQNPPKAESIVLLQGALGYVTFDDNGVPEEETFVLLEAKRGKYGVDTRAGVWHTFFALEPDTVVFEVKPGPHDSSSDKEVAVWAPSENSPEATRYLMDLEDRFRSVWTLPPRSWSNAH